jgi:hypothetical protein
MISAVTLDGTPVEFPSTFATRIYVDLIGRGASAVVVPITDRWDRHPREGRAIDLL